MQFSRSFSGSEGDEGRFEEFRESSSQGTFPTYFVFIDLPKHIEFRFQDLPILQEGLVMEFDLNIKNPKDPSRSRKIQGSHILNRCILKCGGKRAGITQYIEWKAVKS